MYVVEENRGCCCYSTQFKTRFTALFVIAEFKRFL
jgi:hypothetical protein